MRRSGAYRAAATIAGCFGRPGQPRPRHPSFLASEARRPTWPPGSPGPAWRSSSGPRRPRRRTLAGAPRRFPGLPAASVPTPESSASLLTVFPLTAAAGVRHVCAQFVRLRVLVLVTVLLRYGGEIGFVLAAGGERDRPGRANQRQMGERLRHVTHLPLLVSVVLLREQPDVIAESHQAIQIGRAHV